MIYLAQTDTTAGFLSKDLKALNKLKKRQLNKSCLITTAKFSELQKLTRIPKYFKNTIRKSKKTTFLYSNSKAIRVVKDCAHEEFLKQFDWLYSTSANKHGKKFDEKWARQNADEVIDEIFFENSASKIFKLRGTRLIKVR
ncbi:Sua5 YciO YrdC YwlC family protein [Campylobacter insulaenigrae]|uniref:Sua5 YciO YrdC YwlC family protein n=1 Tax=Campylobacter insulaenigrae TaxID=260714 RepID=UPI0021530137|nr:Sua5 YciO YrdC YwlC family protein [Campylobacter insulaenigrae]MCR6572615.1 Sua5 YciO YrdC YwlC family protein [Campylobacter insulaenigrae]MCR6575707.1 Sua5 YciO YrdC YwlC family protein [Campylobacter insulaenigrae]MCR6579239.1 Sua5 YciO YrdC YwlC family protein [Campylobacter insulaenigrae]MCR6581911.1 Sua5 YciO YrdC YwlC family protein [Campylobacter insulaenigrae]MCR6583037.1 Sua5 YciO YrdC YwlC family protein [Campylobacter insulaenigrae]